MYGTRKYHSEWITHIHKDKFHLFIFIGDTLEPLQLSEWCDKLEVPVVAHTTWQ